MKTQAATATTSPQDLRRCRGGRRPVALGRRGRDLRHPRPERGGQDHHGRVRAWTPVTGCRIDPGAGSGPRHSARGIGGGDPGLDAGPVPARAVAAGAGRVRAGLRLHRQALLPMGIEHQFRQTGGTMNTPPSAVPDLQLPPPPVTEYEGRSIPGVRILVLGVLALLLGIALLITGIALSPGSGPIALIVVGVLLILAGEFGVHGLTSVVAGQARVVQLFGRYWGTIRSSGLHWVNPFARR